MAGLRVGTSIIMPPGECLFQFSGCGTPSIVTAALAMGFGAPSTRLVPGQSRAIAYTAGTAVVFIEVYLDKQIKTHILKIDYCS